MIKDSYALSPTLGNSSFIYSTRYTNQNKVVVTTSGGTTIHAFFASGSQTATCGGVAKNGVLWWTSTDDGATWTCQDSFLSTTADWQVSAVKDQNDNIYVVYSVCATGASVTNDLMYRKLTKSGGSWTVGAAQTVRDSTASDAYTFASITLEGTTRLWIASRYYDTGSGNYRVNVYYSDGLTDAPTWTESISPLDTAGTNNGYHIPSIVRFGNRIGVIYNTQTVTNNWRYRYDNDPLNTWSQEEVIVTSSAAPPVVTTDSQGNVYTFTQSGGVNVLFSHYNGVAWSPISIITTTGLGGGSGAIATDGTNVWVIYPDSSGLSSGLSGKSRLMYRKCSPPYDTTSCESPSTAIVSNHGTLDKYWSYVGSNYVDDTTDSADSDTTNTVGTGNDVQMATNIGDIVYIGKSEKFDSLSYDLATNGVGGAIQWEYYNGAWTSLTLTSSSAPNFTADGWLSFTAPGDWITTNINGEATSYYYIRARVITSNYSTSPVGVQFATIPAIYYQNFSQVPVNGKIYGIWAENAATVIKIRAATISLSTENPNTAGSNELQNDVFAYSGSTMPTAYNMLRGMVKSSNGTLHAFINSGLIAPCANTTSSTNNYGLVWVSSIDQGSTWTCNARMAEGATVFNGTRPFNAHAVIDGDDNIYVVYSQIQTGGNASYDVYYRKFSTADGITWTMNSEQKVLDSTADTFGYADAVIELEGTTRIWLAARYYNATGTQYTIPIYYSDGLGTAPVWSLSTASIAPSTTQSDYNVPIFIKYGNKLGIAYSYYNPLAIPPEINGLRWKFRTDGTDLTTWSDSITISGWFQASNTMYGLSDNNGNLYIVMKYGANLYIGYSNNGGITWDYYNIAPSVTSSTLGKPVIDPDGSALWVFYMDSTGMSASIPGGRRIVYKKCILPFDIGACTSAIPLNTKWGMFEKVWLYTSGGGYVDETSVTLSPASDDVFLPMYVDDAVYFGRTEKFDAVSWDVSTSGVGGRVAWEYWNGSTWVRITDYLGNLMPNMTADGYFSFVPNTDWQQTSVNGEGSSYYYVRARVIAQYSVAPKGVIFNAIAPLLYLNSTINPDGNDKIDVIWTENSYQPSRIRSQSITVTRDTGEYNNADSEDIGQPVIAEASSQNVWLHNNMHKLVETQGENGGVILHAFLQTTVASACMEDTYPTYTPGLNWIYSTDNGDTWVCGGQLSSDSYAPYYASAVKDSQDNIYVIYSQSYHTVKKGLYYRKFTKQVGSPPTWIMGPERVIASVGGTDGYALATVAIEGDTRLWIASRYYDGTNQRISAFYSNDLTDNPTFTLSAYTIDTANTNVTREHLPYIVQFGNRIGIIYQGVAPERTLWRYRSSTDPLDYWSPEEVIDGSSNGYIISPVGGDDGNLYLATNDFTNGYYTFQYYNGVSWSDKAILKTTRLSTDWVILTMKGQTATVHFADIDGMALASYAPRRMGYVKGVYPFTTEDFDDYITYEVPYQEWFDKVWTFNGTYTDQTLASWDLNDTDFPMVTNVGDIIYLGKDEKFDAISVDMDSANYGVGGNVVWEYWNGNKWARINNFWGSSQTSFGTDTAIEFAPNTDWEKTSINGESEQYYYVRARTLGAYTTTPLATQIVSVPALLGPYYISRPIGNTIFGVNPEGTVAPYRVRAINIDYPHIPTDLGPSNYTDNTYHNNSQPTFNFSLSSEDVTEDLKYRFQIDDTDNYDSPIVDYISEYAVQGVRSFTVGQAEGNGEYNIGSEGQELSEGGYYWRVIAIDETGDMSINARANNGAMSFNIDLTPPTIPSIPTTPVSPTTNRRPTISWGASTDDLSGLSTSPYKLQWCKRVDFYGCDFIYSLNQTNSYTFASDIPIGIWYFRVLSIDAAGNFSDYSSPIQIIIWGLAPDEQPIVVPEENEPSISTMRYDLEVLVTDADGNPISGAKVYIAFNNHTSTTDSNGIARFYDLTYGNYQVVITYDSRSTIKSIVLGDNTELHRETIELESQPTPTLSSGENNTSITWIIIIVVAIIGTIVIYLFKTKRSVRTTNFYSFCL